MLLLCPFFGCTSVVMDTGGTSVVVRGGCGGAGVIVSSAGGTYGRSADQSNRQTQFAFVATAVALQ